MSRPHDSPYRAKIRPENIGICTRCDVWVLGFTLTDGMVLSRDPDAVERRIAERFLTPRRRVEVRWSRHHFGGPHVCLDAPPKGQGGEEGCRGR